jgi:hypothetical protein
MGLFGRRKRKRAELEMRQQAQSAALELAPRLERAIMTLAVHAQQIDDRLKGLEDRMVTTDARFEQLPTQSDVMAVRVHSAQVLTELASVSLELRTELGRMRDEQRQQLERIATNPAPVMQYANQAVIGMPELIDLDDWESENDEELKEPTTFLRPDAPEFSSNEASEPITWGPHRQ